MNANLAKLPKAYTRGKQNFYGRDFYVTPDVLIPRPETEQLIDMVLNLAGKAYLPGVLAGPRKLPEKPVIYDVGTGSGCIAVTLALELPEAEVIATDISPAALKIAQKNAAHQNAELTFIIAHLLKNVKHKPDLVVANLPYVDPDWEWLDKEALSFEPAEALYAEEHGLKLIKELILQASELGVKYLALEADPCQHAEIAEFAAGYGYTLAETRGFAVLLVHEHAD